MTAKVQPKHKTEIGQRPATVGWLMLSPAIILMIVFLIIPIILTFVLAFTNARLISRTGPVHSL